MLDQFENIVMLTLPQPHIEINPKDWVQYNPRKQVNRWGVSLTSLDGQTSGIPDLDSLKEYNRINGTRYTESQFNVKTPFYESFRFLDQYFEIGRSHFLKLGVGGFFPAHRDLDKDTFRLIYTYSDCESGRLVWIVDGQVLQLANRSWYYVNTKKEHSVFSFFGSQFAVFNVLQNEKAMSSFLNLIAIG